jgi:adenylate cyclase
MIARNFFAELKRRNVYKVAIAYGVVSWLLMQVASQIFPFFEIPNWAVRFVVLAIIIGFPIALILAWAFELTPEGIKRAEDVDLSKSITRKTGRKLDFFIIAVLLLVIGILVFQRLHPNVSPTARAPDASTQRAGIAPPHAEGDGLSGVTRDGALSGVSSGPAPFAGGVPLTRAMIPWAMPEAST